MTIRSALTLTAAALAFAPAIALAQEASPVSVRVRVVDSGDQRGLALARVILSGPVLKLGYTDGGGYVAFDGVPAGLYQLQAVKAGYRVTADRIEIRGDESLSIQVALALATVKTIAKVTVKASSNDSPKDLSLNGPVGKTNHDLPDIVRFDPNALVGPDGSIAIDGQPASATGYALDGIPLSGPGAGFDSRLINADLFSSVDVSTRSSNGGTSGTVNLHSYEPTVLFRDNAFGRVESDGNTAAGERITGSSGNLGYVLGAVSEGMTGPFDGRYFVDTSGLGYVHHDAAVTDGELAKIRLGLTPAQALTFTGLASDSHGDDPCAQDGALLPCGYGPVTGTRSSLRLGGLKYTGLFGKWTTSLVSYVRSQDQSSDESAGYFAGAPFPQSQEYRASNAGLNAVVGYSGARDSVQAAAQLTRSDTTLDSTLEGSAGSESLAQSFHDLSVTASFPLGSKLTLAPALRDSGSATQNVFSPEAGVKFDPDVRDDVALSYVPRRSGIASTLQSSLAPPQALAFDCASGDATVPGTGAYGSTPSTSQAGIAWSHTEPTWRSIVNGFWTHQNDALVPGYVNGAAENFITPAYLASATQIYDSAFGCGAKGALPASDIFVSQPVSLTETTAGVAAALSARVTRNLTLVPSLGITRAVADTVGPELQVPRSVIVPGAQLPGVPFERWSLLADYHPTISPAELILSLQHVASNNPNFLPSYTVLGGGVYLPLRAGALIVSGYNLTNRLTGAFATPALGVPLAVNRGRPAGVLGTPLSPQRIGVTYRITLGSSVSSQPQASTWALPAEAQQNTVLRFDIAGLEPLTPPAPLRADLAAPSCEPENVRDAESIVAQLNAYVRALGQARDPASVPVPQIAGVVVGYHALASGYELLLNLDLRATLALGRCGHFAGADDSDVRAYGLGDRSDLKHWQIDFRYVPRFGLIYVANAAQVNLPKPSRPVPQVPPGDAAFTVVDSPACPPDRRGAVAALLQSLRGPLRANQNVSTDAFTLTVHRTGVGSWSSVRLTDPLLVVPFVSCAPIGSATKADLDRAGIGAAALPEVNYASAYGWYAGP
jgi:hypothetical protein